MVGAQDRTDRTAGLKPGTREAAQCWTSAVPATGASWAVAVRRHGTRPCVQRTSQAVPAAVL